MKIELSAWPFILTIIISIGIPLGILGFLIIKKRRYVKPFLIGALVFFLSQIVTRVPIMQGVLPQFEWYRNFSSNNIILFYIFAGLTAGLFEEVGRFIGFKTALKNNITYKDALAFGLGHWGIEALGLIGLSNVNQMVLISSINNGTFKETAGITESQIIDMFKNMTNITVALGGYERILTMAIHVILTLIVVYGIKNRKNIFLLWAILAHAVIDFSLIINHYTNIYVMEGVITIIAIISAYFIYKFKVYFKDAENIKLVK